MMRPMNLKHHSLRIYGRLLTVAVPLLLPALAMARPTEDESATLEGRFEGYAQQVRLTEPGSNAFTWITLIFLTIVTLSVLFKNANRSHLD